MGPTVEETAIRSLLADSGWSQLPQACLEDVLAAGTIVQLAQDDVLPGRVAIVLQGVIGAFRGDDLAQAAVTALYFPRDLIELDDLPDDGVDMLVAMRPAQVLSLPASALHAAMHKHAPLAQEVLTRVKRQAHDLREHVAELTGKAPEHRLASFLIWVSEVTDPTGDQLSFELPMRRYDMARYLGMQPETLSRKIKALLATGAISLRTPSNMVIEDREALVSLARSARRAA
ncbi:Crp/Fnr family transcriptional regulator [Tropicimonas sp. S265A]|uniref:Crp/Fnr family transcriptional regulator n=1 Tax=Tropicimonas sp. S265A TaxID=3415134 RepID=UPI003C7B6987